MLPSALLGVFVHLSRALGAETGTGDVLSRNSTHSWVFLLLLGGRLRVLVVFEKERTGVGVAGGVAGENDRFRGRDTDGVADDQRVCLAELVLGLRVLDVVEAGGDAQRHAIPQRPRALGTQDQGRVLSLQAHTVSDVLHEVFLELGLLALDVAERLVVDVPDGDAVADLLHHQVVHRHEKPVVALLRLVRVDHEGARNSRAVRLVAQAEGCDDDTRVEVVVGDDRGPLQVELAAALYDGTDGKIQLLGIKVGGQFLLVGKLDRLPKLVVVQLLLDEVGQGAVLDQPLAVEDVGHLVQEVGMHQRDACFR